MTDPQSEIGPWLFSQSDLVVREPGEADFQEADQTFRFRMWEREDRVRVSVALGGDGARVVEVSAGRFFLRVHDPTLRHQILRSEVDLPWALDQARRWFRGSPDPAAFESGASLQVDDEGRPTRATIGSQELEWRHLIDRLPAGPPPALAADEDWTWEIYLSRRLPFFRRLLTDDGQLPAVVGGARFSTGFLYAASWQRSAAAHLIWVEGEDEIELVVFDRPIDTAAISKSARSGVIHATNENLHRQALDALPIERFARVDQPMPVVTGPIGRWRVT